MIGLIITMYPIGCRKKNAEHTFDKKIINIKDDLFVL